MPSTSAIVNAHLRAKVTPLLKDAGFTKVDARNGWAWYEKAVWVFNIRSVGNYFSGSTGWPPGSVGVWLGVYYTFIPSTSTIAAANDGQLTPAEYQCHMRSHLECNLDQTWRVSQLQNPPERSRKDIWWIEPDGTDAENVADDIASELRRTGLNWFREQSDLKRMLEQLESQPDCLGKFDLAAFLARENGDTPRWEKYSALAMNESKRIGRSVDPLRYGMKT